MLTLEQVRQARRRRPPPSLKQQYQEYVLQRIEAYKNTLSRDALLRLGDEAVSELAATVEGQFVLTEVLMLESVDRIIEKRLGLRSYRAWRQQHQKQRKRQREPMHWGVDPQSPLVATILPRLEPTDHVITAGSGAEAAACLLAAHDVAVTYVAPDLDHVERIEGRMTREALGWRFQGVVLGGDGWIPPLEEPIHLLVLDLDLCAGLSPPAHQRLVEYLQDLTMPGGVHLLQRWSTAGPLERIAPWYEDWSPEPTMTEGPQGRPETTVWTKPL